MKSTIVALLIFFPLSLTAQRGDISIPLQSTISVPNGAHICADRIYANNTGYGTLSLANKTCLCSGAIVIPVELLKFSASLQNGTTVLTWTSATEQSNFGFEVQRKTEQHKWIPLGFVEGHGSTTLQHTYRFTDRLMDLPSYCCKLHYRLKQVDTDGHYTFSLEVEVQLGRSIPGFALTGYPSPCDEAYTIRLTLGETGATNIRLHDAAGRIVMHIARDAIFPAGSHSMLLHTAAVPTGLYLLVVESGGNRRIDKVMIQH